MSRFTSDDAAYASNWRRILLVDAVIGWIVLLIGLFLVAGVLGLVLVGAGVAYLVIGLQRARRWKRLRAERGLD